MKSPQLKYLREQRAMARKLREELDNLPPVGWTTLAREFAREGRSIEELYKFLDCLDEHLNKVLVNAARK